MSELPEDVIETPILESPLSKYLREYRLLNSLLISLFAVVLLFALLWNIVVWGAITSEGSRTNERGGMGHDVIRRVGDYFVLIYGYCT